MATPAQVDVWAGLEASSGELPAQLRVLNGFGIGPAAGPAHNLTTPWEPPISDSPRGAWPDFMIRSDFLPY